MLYRALFCVVPDNDKMPVLEYSVSPMIHHSARSSARRNMQSSGAMVCMRSNAAGKLNRVEARGGLSSPLVGFADVAWPSLPPY